MGALLALGAVATAGAVVFGILGIVWFVLKLVFLPIRLALGLVKLVVGVVAGALGMLAMLVAGWVGLPGSPWPWTLGVLAKIARQFSEGGGPNGK